LTLAAGGAVGSSGLWPAEAVPRKRHERRDDSAPHFLRESGLNPHEPVKRRLA
jgi:hypothetical protein